MPGQLRPAQDTAGDHDVLGADLVAPVGGGGPAPERVVPDHAGDLGLEERGPVHVEMAAEQLAVLEDLGGVGVLHGRHVAGLLQHREVDVGLDVAHAARVPVPVPGAAEVAALLDDPEVGDAELGQVGGGEHPAEATADDDDLGVGDDRVAHDRRRVRVVVELLVLAGEVVVLRVGVGPESLLPLDPVPLLRRFEAEAVRGNVVGHGAAPPRVVVMASIVTPEGAECTPGDEEVTKVPDRPTARSARPRPGHRSPGPPCRGSPS